MSTPSITLDAHFKKQKPELTHLEYLDQILWSINKVHIEKVMEIRNTIKLTLLDSPESKNEVVSYLSTVNNRLQSIWRKRGEYVRKEIQVVTSV